jgi:hypothetical protein
MRTSRRSGGLSATVLVVASSALWSSTAFGAAPAEPVTEPVTGVTASSAVLSGVLSPSVLGEPGSTYEFLYKATGTVSKAECEAGASKAPEPAGIAAGGESEPVAIEVGGLTPGTNYIACLAATSTEAETSIGPAVAFKTAITPETPEVQPASAVKGTTATFHGILNPNAAGDPGTYEFIYSPSGSECLAEGAVATLAEPSPGSEGEEVSANVTGLVGGTSYTFCLRVTNGAGEAAMSAGSSFETPAEKPVVVSETATGISPFAATLQAEVNPENETSTSCVFEYGKTVTDNQIPCEQIELTGSFPNTVTRALAGLTPGSKYHYRVVVVNATGETKGPEETFETLPTEAPAVTGESVTGITPFQARLEGALNPNFQLTHCSFTYGPTVATENTVGCEPEFLEGSGEQPIGTTITSLQPATTYHYRVVAKNATGATEGSEQEFTTLALEAPIFGSEEATEVTNTDAHLSARLNPDAQEPTTYSFEYASDETVLLEGKGTRVPGEAGLPAVFEEVTAGPVDLANALKPETTYFFRVIATNPTGTLESPVQQFTTLAAEPPIVISETASNLTETGVTFEATIDPVGQESTYSFQYATDEAFTEEVGSVPGAEPLAASKEALAAGPVSVTGLKAATVYFYRAVATNPLMGTTHGPTQQLKTLGKPAATTGAAGETTRTTAIVSGTVNPGGAATTYRFLYAPEGVYDAAATECPEEEACEYANGAVTPSRDIASTSYTTGPVGPETLGGLKAGTTYHYALQATNQTGTATGSDQTFTTQAARPPTATIGSATGVTASSATIAASIDTKGLATSTQLLIGTEPNTLTATPGTAGSESGNTLQIAASLQGLQPSVTYYYAATATNQDGATQSTLGSFTTLPGSTVPTLPSALPLLTFAPISALNAKEAKENKQSSHKRPTRAQLLAKALKACHKQHGKRRAGCVRKAQQKYGRHKR